MTTSSLCSLLIFLFFTLSIQVQALVPPSKTFKFVNNEGFGEYISEYDAGYRYMNIDNFETAVFPFQFFFYNTTPDAYLLGLRMATPRYEAQKRWVWDANRGNPIRENGTLTFGADGNLVIADFDGRLVWQTGTANKGVVDIQLLPTGNLVLLNSRGGFVWQSFDHATDTLLVGQSLRIGGTNKLVSRLSSEIGSNGPYSFVLENTSLSLYFKTENSAKPLLYYRDDFSSYPGTVTSMVFVSEPETDNIFGYDLLYQLYRGNLTVGTRQLSRPKINSTYSMLRLYYDGSLKVETFFSQLSYDPWQTTYSLFDRNVDNSRVVSGDTIGTVSECKLPRRCGSLGVCEESQCVACPTRQGLLGWSKDCAPPRLPSCSGGAKNIDYYKVSGVEHYTGDYTPGDGPVKLGDCRERCSKDCGCLGFFYREESSKCFLAPDLGTLTRVSNQTHVAYIKISK